MGWLNWLVTGIGAAAAPFTGGLSLAGASAVNAALPRGNQSSASGTPGSSSGNWLTGRQLQPNVAPFMVPGMVDRWGDWMQSQIGQGAPGYPGQLFPDLGSTMLPNVFAGWDPSGGSGQNYFNSFLNGGGFQMPAQSQNALAQLMAGQGMGGRPGQLMESMAQYGGTGGKGHNAVDMMMQYGAASNPVGQFLSNLAQFGIAGPAGQPLHDRAMGAPTAASRYLSAYGTGGK
jgi:hypothetical protein